MAISEVVPAPVEIIDIMRDLIDPTDIPNHKSAESSLMSTANAWRAILGPRSRFYKFDEDTLRPFCGLAYGASSSEGIVMPLRVTNSNSEIKYSRCFHDVAAIQFDKRMENLAPRDKWDKAVDEINTRAEEYLNSAFSRMRGPRRNLFKIIIFDDINDLETKLNSLSNDELQNPIRKKHHHQKLLAKDSDSVPPPTWFRSLHLLVQDSSAIGGKLEQGAFFLNVLSLSPMGIDLCDYSCRVDCCVPEARADGSVVGNFVNLVNSFLIAINLDRGDQLDFGHLTRHRLVTHNLETVKRGFESKAFFCEETVDTDLELKSIGSPICEFVPFGQIYHIPHSGDPPSFLYDWLHEYNFRVFNSSMKDQIQAPDLNWRERQNFDPQYQHIRDFFHEMMSYSDIWKSYVDKINHACTSSSNSACTCGFHHPNGSQKPKNHINVKTYKKVLDLVMDVENDRKDDRFDEIVAELESASLHSEIVQLVFYKSILPQIITIRERLTAPSGHLGLNSNYDFFFEGGSAKVSLRYLMFLGIYFDLVELCENVIALQNHALVEYQLYPSAWPDFSKRWGLHRGSAT